MFIKTLNDFQHRLQNPSDIFKETPYGMEVPNIQTIDLSTFFQANSTMVDVKFIFTRRYAVVRKGFQFRLSHTNPNSRAVSMYLLCVRLIFLDIGKTMCVRYGAFQL